MPRKRSSPLKKSSPPEASEPVSAQPHPGNQPALPFPIVGVGASAGGLEATNEFLHALPVSTGMAFVLVHHLPPGRTSMLGDILSRSTTMPVHTVEDAMLVEPNQVYVIPPGAAMVLEEGVLRLLPRTRSDGAFRPVDQFLQSLAAEQGYMAIGVILSGTATDGTAGCEEIKAEGGITFAQDNSAQQDGMPQSAVMAGCVDFVLSPRAIAKEIDRISRHPLLRRPADGQTLPVEEDRVNGILDMVRSQTGMDFAQYKRSTVLRRVARRMVLHRIDGVREYEEFLGAHPGEADALFRDFLINVTSFFRDPENFEKLKTRVFSELTRDRSRLLPVRIWVLGCSTGEEAYSMAIAFAEFAAMQTRAIPVQIFASDLSPAGIEKARGGFYSKAIEHDLSAERLRRFFVPAEGGYRINKSLLDMVVFAKHNALSDPPFSHVDLITCRNVLIYLGSALQQRLIPILHYALNPGGYLLLGNSETVGSYSNLFEQVDQKHKLYQRKPVPSRIGELLPRPGHPAHPVLRIREKINPPIAPGTDPHREADRLLLSRYAPPGVLVNEDFDVLLFRGDTSSYLTPSPGRASLNLLKMLREGLLIGVRGALLKAKREGHPVRVAIRGEGAAMKVNVEVIPVRPAGTRESAHLVLFDDAALARARALPSKTRPAAAPRGERPGAEVVRLRQELAATREYLQSVIEQEEASNADLQSANEEVQSTNEELQSINEELETSKEEIQSSSEELATVNDELSTRNLELSQSHNDLTNLISSVQVPIVILGPDFRIRRFTPSAEQLLNLIGTDVGRPITDIKPNVELSGLENLLAEVMATVSPQERLVQDREGHWYSLRLRPYRTQDNRIDGVVLMLVDIHSLKEAEESIRRSAERLAILQDQAPLGIRESDLEGRYLQVNQAYCAITGYTRDELLGRKFIDFLPPEERDRAWELLQKVLVGEIPTYREERRHYHKSGRILWLEVNGFALRDESAGAVTGVAFVQDISERHQAEVELLAADRSKNEFLAMLAHELRNPLAPLLNAAQLLGAPNLPRERTEALRSILERQIRNLSRMTDDLLDVSRISRGQLRLHSEVIEIGAIARRAVDLFRPILEARGQAFEVELPEDPILLPADAVRLEQLLDNLLTNASKFSESGGHIRLSLRQVAEPPPGIVEIRVRDQGRGIAAELLPTVFEPFVQAEQSMDRTRGGLGIGLTLVRTIAELHGGTVEAGSAGPGQGAEFVVRLPLPKEPVTLPVERRKTARHTVRHRVLIVDDNLDAAETLALLLRHEDHEVRIAHDGETALRQFPAYRPTIVLLDIGLPGRDGIEVAGQLREQAQDPRPTIIGISGYGQEEIRQRAREAGMDFYFTKPVDITNLVRLFTTLP